MMTCQQKLFTIYNDRKSLSKQHLKGAGGMWHSVGETDYTQEHISVVINKD